MNPAGVIGGLAAVGMLAGCGGSRDGPDAVPSAAPWFVDVTDAARVGFVHRAPHRYLMPDQMGSGVALLDADGDGRLDLYLVQNDVAAGAANVLLRQEADGRFRDVSAGSGLDVVGNGMGAIAGDVNNDGRTDVVVTEYGRTRVFVNEGGLAFREITDASGVDNPRWAVPASLVDYDRDGWLDLVVGNYLDFDPTQRCLDVQGREDFCAPQAFPPTMTRLWRNVTASAGAEPRFEDRTVVSGLSKVPGAALGLVCADLTGDGWPDILCADDGRPNRLFVNRRDGTFVDEAVQRGVAFNAMGRTAANMGLAYGDFDGDALGDVFVTHLTEEYHALYRQDAPGLFVDVVGRAGLQQQGWRGTGFGVVFTDFDHDGHVDLAFVNGLIRRAVPGQTPVGAGVDPWWGRYAQRAQLFVNTGSGSFRDVSSGEAGLCGLAWVGRSLAAGDLNGDGAVDLVVGSVGGPVRLLRNVAPHRGRWLRVRMVDPAWGGRDAIGAELRVHAGGRQWWAVLQPATSYLSSHEPVLHFGLGDAPRIDSLEASWPDGTREVFEGGDIDRTWVVAKGSGRRLP